jgi:hypothetical protein
LLWLFWRWGSCKLLAQAGLKLWSSQSQPPMKLGLQAWATSTSSFFVSFVFKPGFVLAKQAFYHLSYTSSPFWRWESHELFVQSGLQAWYSWCQPPK